MLILDRDIWTQSGNSMRVIAVLTSSRGLTTWTRMCHKTMPLFTYNFVV